MKKKYILIPGRVRSKNDSQIHYIDAGRLASLYKVKLAECYVIREDKDKVGVPDGLMVLEPRFDGNYEIPRGDE